MHEALYGTPNRFISNILAHITHVAGIHMHMYLAAALRCIKA